MIATPEADTLLDFCSTSEADLSKLRHAMVHCRERASWKAFLVHVERGKRGIWNVVGADAAAKPWSPANFLDHGESMPQCENLEVQGGWAGE